MSLRQTFILLLCAMLAGIAHAQPARWQQRVHYQMNIDMDVKMHRYQGAQRLAYHNNSPDTLTRLFYHLYLNAFQPGGMMDVRTRLIEDPDRRMAQRIAKLKPDEQGYIKVSKLLHNGADQPFRVNETILEVTLNRPILPGAIDTLYMEWEAQIPLQIRRNGRNSSEGIAYSMSQWYPKLCEYDEQGWHANPYIGREFYGVWGDYDVTIRIDRNYVVAAGGYLQNPDEVGFGYESSPEAFRRPNTDKLTWRFFTPNVHDYVWAADPDYTQTSIRTDNGTLLRFFYQKGKGYDEAWEALPRIMSRAMSIANERFGEYPYKEYSFIQGGDGGMEYPLATLITGNRPLRSLVGVSVHEMMHSWYQMVLGFNESLYYWMDEGFTSWAEDIVMNELAREGLLPGASAKENPFDDNYTAYRRLALSGKEEPLTTHADYFHTNFAYGLGAYVKGSVFLSQLGYVIGEEALMQGMRRFYHTWKFRHPNANDLIRVMEKQSGLELDWYKEAWIHTTNTIDYGIKSVESDGRRTKVSIARVDRIAMPLDILVTYANGETELFYAPLESMRGEKPAPRDVKRTALPQHRWVDTLYEFEIPERTRRIARIEIDPSGMMADVNREDNVWTPK